jgi:N-acetyl-anhydromuramyl-L-alanine amidase AmpD
MEVIKKELPETEYYKNETLKHQIILHHTVASNFNSTYTWWQQDGIHVATAYIIDKDGTIYEMFNPKYWSYHLGKGTTTRNNKAAIGIELVNEGPLWKKNGKYYWWNGTAKYNRGVYNFNSWWRGHKYFAAYEDAQLDSLVELLKDLTAKFNIKKKVIKSYGYDHDLLYKNCILSHHNVRRDKTDISVALDLDLLDRRLNENVGYIQNTLNKIRNTIWD